MRSEYKKIDTETAAWDLDAGCRNIIINNESNRKLRKRLRRMARKKIDREYKEREEE